jgi:hypothetical protein
LNFCLVASLCSLLGYDAGCVIAFERSTYQLGKGSCSLARMAERNAVMAAESSEGAAAEGIEGES